ncbi:MAG: citrate synthase [Candidatus Sumerlaeaceae bacterium]|nr:citrate synthase [Candidatus Sumerlaeaceae bacterium]
MSTPTFSPGLAGVTAGVTAISEVDADRNKLTYRGYDVHDLVEHTKFDEVAHLMLLGKLPTKAELDAFIARTAAQREVSPAVYELFRKFPADANCMDVLRAGVAIEALFDPDAHKDTPEAHLQKSLRLYAKIPTLVVNGYRILKGMEPVKPSPTLPHSENFWHMLAGGAPNEFFVTTVDATQILYAEHGFNASTFASRVTVSTLSDIYSGTVSAIGTLKGNLHGGANEAAMEMLLEIGEATKADAYIRDALAKKKKIMGFGHREYKHGDERAKIVKTFVVELSKRLNEPKWLEISNIVEGVMLKEKNLYPNLDFPVASSYYMMKLPVELYTPIFVMSRITGWCAHMMEQLANNRIIRPHNEYNGPKGLTVPPISARK